MKLHYSASTLSGSSGSRLNASSSLEEEMITYSPHTSSVIRSVVLLLSSEKRLVQKVHLFITSDSDKK